MKKLEYKKVSVMGRYINFTLSAMYAAFGVFMFYNGSVGYGILGLVLSVLFIFIVIAQGIAENLSETIRTAKSVLEYLDLSGKAFSNHELMFVLFQLDVLSYARRNKSFTNTLWVKKNGEPSSLYLTKIIESYNQKSLPQMPIRNLTTEEKEMIDESIVGTLQELIVTTVQDSVLQGVPEGSLIQMKKLYGN